MEMAESVFRRTKSLPKKEDYGLTSQIRRASLSISANSAEAFVRYHGNDTINFYYFSRVSKPNKVHESIHRFIKSLNPQFKSQSQPKSGYTKS